MKQTRKGFTLIELLIVIVVIGILAAMMMFSSTEAVSSAKASNIISNMRQLKTAMIAWYVDNLERVVPNTGSASKYKIKVGNSMKEFSEFVNTNSAEIMKYISNGNSKKLLDRNHAKDRGGEYIMTAMAYSTKWYVCYNVGNDTRLKAKLAGRQKSAGLLGTNQLSGNVTVAGSNKSTNVGNLAISDVYTDQEFVCMLILDFGD